MSDCILLLLLQSFNGSTHLDERSDITLLRVALWESSGHQQLAHLQRQQRATQDIFRIRLNRCDLQIEILVRCVQEYNSPQEIVKNYNGPLVVDKWFCLRVWREAGIWEVITAPATRAEADEVPEYRGV